MSCAHCGPALDSLRGEVVELREGVVLVLQLLQDATVGNTETERQAVERRAVEFRRKVKRGKP